MKQKDIALIIIVVFISAVVSFVVSGKIFVTADNRQQQVEVVDVISPEFKSPSTTYFNANSVNPTVAPGSVDSANQDPFNGSDSSN